MVQIVAIGTDEVLLHEALLAVPPVCDAELSEIAKGLGLAGHAGELMAALAELGLVVDLPGQPPRWLALLPDVALEVLTARQQRDLAAARLQVAELAARFLHARTGDDLPDAVELLIGEESIVRRFDELQRATRIQVRGFVTPPWAVNADIRPAQANPVENEMLARGVAYRVLYDRRSFGTAERVLDLTESVAAGEQARLVEAPVKLIIFDDDHVLMPAGDQQSDDDVLATMVVHEPVLVGALAELFELSWERALPLRVHDGRSAPDHAKGPTVLERLMLILLAGGYSEPDIAEQLGMHERTLRRHLRVMFDKLGAKTRTQAGYQAVMRGWLKP